jgi:hypothetical protein
MGIKSDIGWTTPGPDGKRRHVYAQQVGDQWRFFERPRRRGPEINWVPLTEPPLEDWLKLLDALERGMVRRRYMPEDVARVRKRIRELFPDEAPDGHPDNAGKTSV